MAQQNDEVQRDDNLTEGIGVNDAESTLLGLFTESDDVGDLDDTEVQEEQDHEDDLDDEDLVDDDIEDDDFDDEDDDFDESDDDEDDESDDDDLDSDAPQTFKVTVGGEEVEVTAEELQSGYMRQKDYTQKTMEVAETRKGLREAEETLLGLEQEYEQNLQVVASVLTGGLGFDPDWNAVKTANPENWKQIREEWLERQDQIKAVRGEMARVQQNATQRAKDLREQRVAEEQEKLRAAVPEWLDPAVAKVDAEKLGRTAALYGIEPEEFANVIDHRLILILRDAMRAREMDETADQGKDVRRKTRKKSPTLKSGSRKAPGKTPVKTKKARAAARKRLTQSGKIGDAEAALLTFFET